MPYAISFTIRQSIRMVKSGETFALFQYVSINSSYEMPYLYNMLEFLKSLAPYVGVVVGWGLSESSKLWAEKRVEKRKLKRALYLLLELRYQFNREFNAERIIDDLLHQISSSIEKLFGENVGNQMQGYKPILIEAIKNLNLKDPQRSLQEENIEKTIMELSEISPILAYDLEGRFKSKTRIKLTEEYLEEVIKSTEEASQLNSILKPQLSAQILDSIDMNIEEIAKKIDRRTSKEVTKKIESQKIIDHDEIQSFFSPYLDQLNKLGIQ